jgi:hypothetical protein
MPTAFALAFAFAFTFALSFSPATFAAATAFAAATSATTICGHGGLGSTILLLSVSVVSSGRDLIVGTGRVPGRGSSSS